MDPLEIDFLKIVKSHNKIPVHGDEFVSDVCLQHTYFFLAVYLYSCLSSQIISRTRNTFSGAWATTGLWFLDLKHLTYFLDTVMPMMYCVKGDLFLMNYCWNPYCANLTYFALEGVVYSIQYDIL